MSCVRFYHNAGLYLLDGFQVECFWLKPTRSLAYCRTGNCHINVTVGFVCSLE